VQKHKLKNTKLRGNSREKVYFFHGKAVYPHSGLKSPTQSKTIMNLGVREEQVGQGTGGIMKEVRCRAWTFFPPPKFPRLPK
jgi:hypothetical protein